MIKNNINHKVDWYFNTAKKWQEELEKLRKIVLGCGLTEELKWGVPCYTLNKKNIVLIHVFKEYCALLFFKGALLKDKAKILIQQTKNVQAARQLRFTNPHEVTKNAAVIKAYIYEAVEIEKAGLKIKLKKAPSAIAEEFKNKLEKSAALKSAFNTLTPGRQRAYHFYFSEAKLSKTREARIEKCIPQILNGKGLND
jgi:uncharacterized protein YdeI (YjbR/CyaY-like superfamily)